jgi:uncharacterized protein (DUF433 family)
MKRKTDEELLSRITADPAKMHGRPSIRGMRIRVIDILDNLAHGATREDILRSFPELESEDIDAALLYSARFMAGAKVQAQAAE